MVAIDVHCQARASQNCKPNQCPICGPCWEIIDEDEKERIKEEWNLSQPRKWHKDAWKFCSSKGCWNIVPKARYSYKVGYCSLTQCKPNREPPIRDRSRSRSCSRSRSRSLSRQNHTITTQAVPDLRWPRRWSEMKSVLLRGKILKKQLAQMQNHVDRYLAFTEEVVAKETAASSSQQSDHDDF